MASKSVIEHVDVDIDLSDFSDDELLDEIESRGLDETGTFDSIEHLIICCQIEQAKIEALLIVEKIIGRQFK